MPMLYAEPIEDEPPFAELPDERPVAMPIAPMVRRPGAFGAAGRAAEWCFGVVSIFLGLSVLAAIPLGQFLALGYLLDAAGRVARTGRIGDGFIGVRRAARFGGVALGLTALWLPLYYLSIQAEAARIIDPDGRIASRWTVWLTALALFGSLHGGAALLRGGRFRHFLNPFNVPWLMAKLFRGGLYRDARDRFWNVLVGLKLPYFFWLGFRGFLGAFLWLAIPLTLLGQGHRAPIVGVIGGCLLALVVIHVPFMQVRFARNNRMRAFRQFAPLRHAFRRAPLAFALALTVHLILAIPLYILKIEVIPRDLVFLEGLMFLLLMFPARLLGGWAYARGLRRETPRLWLVRWGSRLALVPVAIAYVLVVFLSQHIGWQGIGSLYEQHAFLLPVPFVSWKG